MAHEDSAGKSIFQAAGRKGACEMLELAEGWTMDVERGPNCLFVHLNAPEGSDAEGAHLAERIWELLERHFTYRLVLELDCVPQFRSALLGQLVLLHKRIAQHGGMMRLCGVSDDNHLVLQSTRLADRFPQYACRTDAVMGARPTQPR